MWRTAPAWVALFFFPLETTGPAVDEIQLEVDGIEHPAWLVQRVAGRFRIAPKGYVGLELSLADIRIPTWNIVIPWLRIECHAIRLDTRTFECPAGSMFAKHSSLGELSANVTLHYRFDEAELDASIKELAFAGGRVALAVRANRDHWRVKVDATRLDLAQVGLLLARFAAWPSDYADASGTVDFGARIGGATGQVQDLRFNSQLRHLNFNGPNVAEDLDAGFNMRLARKGQNWSGAGMIRITGGALYVEPGLTVGSFKPGFAIEATGEPINLRFAAGREKNGLLAGYLEFKHPRVLKLRAHGSLKLDRQVVVESARITAVTEDLARAHEVYLHPLLVETDLSEMELSGALRLRAFVQHNGLSDLWILPNEIFLIDKMGRFHLTGLNGNIRLTKAGKGIRSWLQWRGGGIYKLDIGAGEIALESSRGEARLIERVQVPVLDGEFHIDSLHADNIGSEDFSVRLDGELTPISLRDFCEAMDWPMMEGMISGVIPGLTYRLDLLRVSGDLTVRAFNGRIRIRNLEVKDLLGYIPRLSADLFAEDIDLETLTRTFSFGKIEGKLSGSLKQLRLEDWQPVHFEAEFATPQDDDSQHRISQKAIDNLTNLGGGSVTSLVSRGLLRFYEDFSYSRLGLKCRLSEGVCKMDGVQPANGGYYIVKRGLLPPWLDVKGFNREVEWDVLVDRFKRIAQHEVPSNER